MINLRLQTDLNMAPQASLDAPRFNYDFLTSSVNLEESFHGETYKILKTYGKLLIMITILSN